MTHISSTIKAWALIIRPAKQKADTVGQSPFSHHAGPGLMLHNPRGAQVNTGKISAPVSRFVPASTIPLTTHTHPFVTKATRPERPTPLNNPSEDNDSPRQPAPSIRCTRSMAA